MSMETPVGLFQYPVTKLCMVSCAVVPLVASVAGWKYHFLLQFDPFLSLHHQYYRLLLFQIGCLNESDVALMVLIWYHFRQIERVFGSLKYINLISLVFVYTTVLLAVLNTVMNYVLPGWFWNRYPTGALPILLALFHFYKEYTPKIYEFEVFLAPFIRPKDKLVIKLSDQFLVNALIALAMLNQGAIGVATGFISWMIGVFIDNGILVGLSTWKLPLMARLLSTRARTSINAADQTTSAIDTPQRVRTQDILQDTQAAAPARNDTPSTAGITTPEDSEPNDEPVRPLRTQFLDTFRR
ncbi:Dsc2p KNAG_0K00960 [Huiozyma naganishii CBS 8797]|uniref:Derlin n=1 Tax=Huiozyma naganishii (strain ATCC MYA-139 / BCRC 22969 / CBS 8797 / KCTC 17520 / NBRC 10181 / NCYC 3082 / Yp74L-3) TaxID=1071383 RepID=J7SAT8_HUIN7|nr:hypothetical protein KNAG_0K00960 [Kazachstania naganishii CBS 8797]CCK72461.1 hypothetical protein KNAG_0K00960 [Kazachstania naganishii CBS 8797]